MPPNPNPDPTPNLTPEERSALAHWSLYGQGGSGNPLAKRVTAEGGRYMGKEKRMGRGIVEGGLRGWFGRVARRL
jgi:hypothetical protein